MPAYRSWAWPTLVIGAAVIGGLALTVLSDNPLNVILVAPAMAGAAAVALLIPGRPAAAVGLVFLLAVFELLAIETPVGAMRLEQPAIGALLIAVIWHRRQLELPRLRPIWPLIALGLAYLGVLTASSLIVAPEPALSMRMVAWSALSMTAGLLAALLLADRVREILPWLIGVGAMVALMGLLVGASYFLWGDWTSLIGGDDAGARVYAPAYEPNLYASLVALLVPIAIEHYRALRSRWSVVWVILLLVGLGLGVTRGAYVGLGVGLAIFFLLHIRRSGVSKAIRRAALVTLLAGAAGMLLPAVLLNPQFAGVLTDAPSVNGPTAADRSPDRFDTWEYRMVRVETGLAELQHSPIIGMGAFSYGQRHALPYGSDVIAVLPAAVVHDAGILGLLALSVFFAILGLRLWRAAVEETRGPPAIALAAAVAVMLVSYLATTALHFAVTWLIIGCAVAAAWPRAAPAQARDGEAMHTN